jgi:regulator of protease activity HflC (stomatin/prohibitin superfamily)
MKNLPVFRSAASDVCSRYYAKDMHSAKRNEIEQEIRKRLAEVCEEKGFVIEAKANKAANDMLNSSLTPNVLKMNQIQAFMKLSTSPNTKTIITDGKGGVINMLDDK